MSKTLRNIIRKILSCILHIYIRIILSSQAWIQSKTLNVWYLQRSRQINSPKGTPRQNPPTTTLMILSFHSASVKYSQCFTCSTFCHVATVFQIHWIKFIFTLKILHTIPQSEREKWKKTGSLKSLQIYFKYKTKIQHIHEHSQPLPHKTVRVFLWTTWSN